MSARSEVSHSASRGGVGLLAFLALGLALTMALVALPARGQFADKYDSNGDFISGWHWLRDRELSHYAEFTFTNPPRSGDIILWITALATDGVNGAPNINAYFDFLVGNPGSGTMGGVFQRYGVTLQNIYPQANPPGYTNHGMIRVEREALDKVMAANGTLFIRIVRPNANGPHVAFRPDSIKIINANRDDPDLMEKLLDDPMMQLLLGEGYDGTVIGDWRGQREGGGPDGQIVIDDWPGGREGDGPDGGEIVVERGGDTTGPDDGLPPDMHPEEGDWGDEGQCWLDRPCIGDVADGFRSTGFAGAEGWYWLRAPTVGQTADYLFETPPLGKALVLDIAVLGQNLVGATPKDALHVHLTLGYPGSGSLGGQVGPVSVEIPRLWIDPEDDVWRGRALVVIPADMAEAVIPAVGGLFLSFERIDAFEPDVGFSAGSVLLYPAEDASR